MNTFVTISETELQEVNGGSIRLEGNIKNVIKAYNKAKPYLDAVEEALKAIQPAE